MAEGDRCQTDVVVIGAGISGLVTAKCLKQANFKVKVLEKTDDVGGLWTFRENDYGVMRFTHINVSKYNYCFSDFPFPENVPDYPHNKDMAEYIKAYTKHNQLYDDIQFCTKVSKIEREGEKWKVTTDAVEDGKDSRILDKTKVIYCKFVAIASGHHAKPSWPNFPGQTSYTGSALHSVEFKDAITNGIVGKNALVVGIGNSAVDAAVNLVTNGRCKKVYVSTRSGAWVVPNYVFGHPTDLYANRVFLSLPWKLATFIFEKVICLIYGHPKRWGLKPKMHALQTQPTVSPTLIHHIQRGEIKIVPNVQRIENKRVFFMNEESEEFDNIIFCTGYKIDLPYLSEELQKVILEEDTNKIKLYKNVFSPDIGHSMAFIGFVQPASGGILTMSETQARWFTELCKGKISLPSKAEMLENISKEEEMVSERYHKSARHTIQRDPVVYNDEISSFFGAKPDLKKHPGLAWRLLFGSAGAAQWRLQGPHSWEGAAKEVKKVPVTELMHYSGIAVVVMIFVIMFYLFLKFYSLFG